MVDKEITWDSVRRDRDINLLNSDWRFMSDQTPSQEWIDYRQFLRDLPQNNATPEEANEALENYEKPE